MRWFALFLSVTALSVALPVDSDSEQMALVQSDQPATKDVEVSAINDRIFDDAWEKSNFEQRKLEMNNLVAASTPYADRVANCTGSCGEGMKLFTVWTTPAEGWNSKYTRSIDSALYHHPKAQVSIYSSSLPDDFLEDFRRLGYDVRVQRINMKERALGTPLEGWAEKLDQWHDGPYFYAHLSDATRLVVLYTEGGVYFDTDVVFVNPIDTVKNAVGWERPDSLCNAMMVFDKGNPYLKEVLQRFNNNYVMDDWAANGPVLLTDVYEEQFKHSKAVNTLEQAAFYLIQWDEVKHYFAKETSSELERDYFIITRKALVVHFWNSRSHDLIVHPQSLMAKLFTTFCVYCNAVSHPILALSAEREKSASSEKLVAMMN